MVTMMSQYTQSIRQLGNQTPRQMSMPFIMNTYLFECIICYTSYYKKFMNICFNSIHHVFALLSVVVKKKGLYTT